MAAGVVGAGAGAVAAAAPASAAGGNFLLNAVNDGTGLPVTELDAVNSTTPSVIVTNTGLDTPSGSTVSFSGPNLRLTPSPITATAFHPTPSTLGGDLTATADGALYFTHDFTQESPPVTGAAAVHTEATANVFAVLPAPFRILDTRSAILRANIINPGGNLNSSGQLLTGKTIYINLDSLVIISDAVFANVTVTQTTAAGFLTLWSGFPTTQPNSSNINWMGPNVTISNFTAVAVGVYPPDQTQTPTDHNVIAIYTNMTTHVVLDVIGFTTPGFEYLRSPAGPAPISANASRLTRLANAQAALRSARKS